MSVQHLSPSDFEREVLKSPIPVLVDFFAEWCGPCRMMGPILEEVDKALGSKAKVIKVNVDEAQELAGKYGVMSIPTLIIFKHGEIAEQFVGVVAKERLIEKMNALI